jgi:hypothetical protein
LEEVPGHPAMVLMDHEEGKGYSPPCDSCFCCLIGGLSLQNTKVKFNSTTSLNLDYACSACKVKVKGEKRQHHPCNTLRGGHSESGQVCPGQVPNRLANYTVILRLAETKFRKVLSVNPDAATRRRVAMLLWDYSLTSKSKLSEASKVLKSSIPYLINLL